MLEHLEDVKNDFSIVLIGVGTVGCKISHKISKSLAINQSVRVLYAHTSESLLEELTDNRKDHLLIPDHNFFLEKGIVDAIQGSDMVFLVSGLGGETGSKVSPFIARIIQEQGILSIGLFSMPFLFEGRRKTRISQQAYIKLSKYLDSLICFENELFLNYEFKGAGINKSDDLFIDSNHHFEATVKSLVNLLTRPGMINVDLNDVKVVISKMGLSGIGISRYKGDSKLRAEKSMDRLFESQMFKSQQIQKAKSWIVCVSAGMDLVVGEFATVGSRLEEVINNDATVVLGTVIDANLSGEIEVVAIFTGLPEPEFKDIEIEDDFDMVSISKTISFEPHQASAGLSILSYFNDFLHQKYADTKAKVKIEQNGNVVKLIIQSPSGEIESIEKSLTEFGQIVVGQRKAHEILESNLDVQRLEMKLEMAALELRHTEKMLSMYQIENDGFKSRVENLENQLSSLQKTICSSLTFTQKELSKELRKYNALPGELIRLIQKGIDDGLTGDTRRLIKSEVIRCSEDPESLITLRKLLENTVYGVSGNSVFSFIMGILNSLPK